VRDCVRLVGVIFAMVALGLLGFVI